MTALAIPSENLSMLGYAIYDALEHRGHNGSREALQHSISAAHTKLAEFDASLTVKERILNLRQSRERDGSYNTILYIRSLLAQAIAKGQEVLYRLDNPAPARRGWFRRLFGWIGR